MKETSGGATEEGSLPRTDRQEIGVVYTEKKFYVNPMNFTKCFNEQLPTHMPTMVCLIFQTNYCFKCEILHFL